MATELGQAYVQIMPSAKGISGSISKQLAPEATSAGTSAGSLIATGLSTALMAGVAVAAAAVGKLIKSSITEGAALQQSMGGVETLFKDNANKVRQYANEAYRTTGLSANAYMENVTGFSASLLQSLGGDTKKAADVANMAMIDMADNSNKMGTSMESIQYAYQGFAKQNYTMLDNLKLGYGGTKEEMARLLADAEKLTGKKYDMSNLADVYSAIHAVQQEMEITGTTSREAEHTFTGSLNAMKASASNLLGKLALGEDIRPSLEQLASTTYTFFAGNFIPMLGNIFTGLGDIFSYAFTDLIPKMNESLQAQSSTLIAKGFEIVSNILNGILQALPTVITTIGTFAVNMLGAWYAQLPNFLAAGAKFILSLVDGIVQNLPAIVQSVVNVVSKFISTLQQHMPTILQKGAEIILKLVAGLIQRLPDIISASMKIMAILIQGIVSNLPKIMSTGIQILVSLVKGILSAIGQVISAMGRVASTIIESVTGINLSGHGSSIMNGFLNGLRSGFEEVKGFVGGIASWISEHKGPISYDRKLLIPAGNAIMYGLHDGLKDMFNNKVKPLVSGMADDMINTFGSPQLAFDMVSDVKSNAPNYDLSTNRLASQINNTPNTYTTEDLMLAINSQKNKQIVVSAQFDRVEFAKMVAQPVDNVIERQKTALSRLRGEI